MAEQDHTQKKLPTFEEAQKELEERKERELQESEEPKTEVDKILDELKRGEPEPPPEYDQL